jgi:hypothetical protein
VGVRAGEYNTKRRLSSLCKFFEFIGIDELRSGAMAMNEALVSILKELECVLGLDFF